MGYTSDVGRLRWGKCLQSKDVRILKNSINLINKPRELLFEVVWFCLEVQMQRSQGIAV